MPPDPEATHLGLRHYLYTFAALLVLATGSWIIAVLHLPGGVVLAVAIGALKALLVLAYFMHLAEEPFSFKLALGVAAVLVMIFIGLTALDPLTRTRHAPAPMENPGYRAASGAAP